VSGSPRTRRARSIGEPETWKRPGGPSAGGGPPLEEKEQAAAAVGDLPVPPCPCPGVEIEGEVAAGNVGTARTLGCW
jgi:hypothetical protein